MAGAITRAVFAMNDEFGIGFAAQFACLLNRITTPFKKLNAAIGFDLPYAMRAREYMKGLNVHVATKHSGEVKIKL